MSEKMDTFIKQEYTSRKVPDFRVGDVVKIHQLVPDIKAYEVGQKLSKTARAAMKASKKKDIQESSRTQIFEGVVIARKHGAEPGASFTVRKIGAGSVGVEKIFPLYSPLVQKIEIVSRPKVRRAKLYFLRDQIGKRARKFGAGASVDQQITSVSELIVPGSAEEEVAENQDGDQDVTAETSQEEEAAPEEPSATAAQTKEETKEEVKEE